MSRFLAYLSLMLKLALRRLRNRLGLSLLCLLGVCLSVGLVVAIPVFAELVSRLVLRQELTGLAQVNNRPLFTLRYYSMPTTSWPVSVDQMESTGKWLEELTRKQLGLPIVSRYSQVESPGLLFKSSNQTEKSQSGSVTFFSVAFIEGADKNIEVLDGDPLKVATDTQYLEVWVQEPLAQKLGLNVGDTHALSYFSSGNNPDIPIRIAGIWQPKEGSENFWYGDPTKTLQDYFLTTRDAYQRFIEPNVYEGTGFNFWYFVLDDNRMLLDNVPHYIKGLEQVKRLSGEKMPRAGLDLSPIEPLQNAQQRKTMLSNMLLGLSLPVIGLLFFFLGLLSSIAVRHQRGEAAILSSRGATFMHILSISLLEALILAAVGIPLSLLTGYGLARLAGYSYDFLSFGYRDLPNTGIQGINWTWFIAAIGMSIITRLIPAAQAAAQSVVRYVRERSRPKVSPPWLRLTLIIPLVATTAYAYRLLRMRGTLGLLSWDPTGNPMQDPLVFLAPMLFFLTVAMLIASLFPYLMRLLDWAAARIFGLPGYLGFRNLGREGGQYANALFLVILCLAVGAFEASMARSADRWFIERLQYKCGADFNFKLVVDDDSPDSSILPITDYLSIRGVTDAARLGEYVAEYKAPNASRSAKLRLLGIDRTDFQRVVYWRRDYAPESLGALMNRLAGIADGILVPREVLAPTGLNIGDKVTMDVVVQYERVPMTFTIAGVFDYFPTMFPDTDGYAVVANLEYIYEKAGMTLPYGVLLRSVPGLDAKHLYDDALSIGVEATNIKDLRAMISDDRFRLERVGVFGMLSIGFLAASAISCLGLLMYIASSLSSRSQRFAMLRAIGFSLNQLMTVVTLEFITVIIYGVLSGSVLGIAASYLFVPFFQLTEDPSLPIPPFTADIAWQNIQLFAVIFIVVLVAATAALLYGVMRRQLAQTLRLGDQE